jgi:hypothetical protein
MQKMGTVSLPLLVPMQFGYQSGINRKAPLPGLSGVAYKQKPRNESLLRIVEQSLLKYTTLLFISVDSICQEHN